MFAGPSEASSTSGEFAYSTRLAWSQLRAPDAHASSRATTWSICTAELVFRPRLNWIVRPVYGSDSVPDVTWHLGFLTAPFRSRARMVSRVVADPHPLDAQPPKYLSLS